VESGPSGIPGDVLVTIRGADGDSAYADDCARRFERGLRGQVYSDAVRWGLQEVVDELLTRGYPYAQSRLQALDISASPHVDFVVVVYPGPRVYAGDLRTGADRTPDHFFAREAGWTRGALLDDQVIVRSAQEIRSLPFVAELDTARLVARTVDTADLLLPVREVAGVRIGGVFGYVPAAGNRTGYWGGEINLQLQSPFGGGRSVALQTARRDPLSRRTQFSWWEPRPWNTPLWLGLSLRQDDFGTDFIETEGVLSLRTADHTPGWEVQFSAARISPEENPSPTTWPGSRLAVALGVRDSSSSGGYTFGVRWNRQRLYARAGVAPPQDVVDHSQVLFGAHRWLGLSRQLHLRLLATGAGTLVGSGLVPTDLLFRIGGLHSLRGYREEEFLVRDYLRAGWEGHIGSRMQSLFVFVEAAWLNPSNRVDYVLGSVGAGFRFARHVELLLGVPSAGGMNNAKIHIGLNTAL